MVVGQTSEKGLLKTLNDSSFCCATTRESHLCCLSVGQKHRNAEAAAAADGHICRTLMAVSDAYLASHGGVSSKHPRCDSCAKTKKRGLKEERKRPL